MHLESFEEQLAELNAQPDPMRVAAIERVLLTRLSKVRPLPPDRVLWTIGLMVFFILAVTMARVTGMYGLERLSPVQRGVTYGIVLMSALLVIMAAAERMVPGSRTRVPAWLALLFPLVAFTVAVPVMFPDFSVIRFTALGVPCLQLGVVCSIPSGLLAGWLMQRGYVTEPVSSALVCGAFAGLVGMGVLGLHCPIQNGAHVMTWHVTVIVIAAAVGALTGWIVRSLSHHARFANGGIRVV